MAGTNPLESTVKTNVNRRARQRGAYVVTVQHIHGRGVAGTPDDHMAYRGIYVCAEVKRPAGRGRFTDVSPAQLAQLELARRAGAVACVLRSKEDVDRVFDAIDRALDGGSFADAFDRALDGSSFAGAVELPADLSPPRPAGAE